MALNKNQKRQRFIKKVGVTLVIPLFLMIVGATMVLVPLWDVFATGITLGSVIFNNPGESIAKVSFDINGQEVMSPDFGQLLGNLKIDSVSLLQPVYHGDNREQLRKGVGHYVGSVLPGQDGNVVLSGHREVVFMPLKDVEIGDEVLFETDYGTYKYVISDIYITTPDDISPTMPTDDERLTMYTCYPFIMFGPTPQRYIVVADLVDLAE